MKRISSLPVAEFCAMADKIGQDVASVNAQRSTCFHSYCETGRWPELVNNLPEQDFAEIQRWKKPTVLLHKNDVKSDSDGYLFVRDSIRLEYKDAIKEIVVGLDKDYNFVEVDPKVPQKDIASTYPDAIAVGHLDMAWHLPSLDLVVVEDIKSSVFAVKAREKSLQLHAYGIAFAKKMGAKKYKVGIWDATDGKHYMGDVIELDSWECEEYKARIRSAAANDGDNFTTGTHCGGCWKRDICPAHLVEPQADNKFAKVLGPNPTESDIREAMIAAKQMETLSKKIFEIAKGWADRHGGIRSEDGLKLYRPQLRSGRKSLDTQFLQSELGLDSLEKYMKVGNDFVAYDWCNVKEGK